MSDKSQPSLSTTHMKKFIKVGSQVINLDIVATVELSQESVIIVLATYTEKQLAFSGQEAEALKDYFSNSSNIEILPPQKPPLDIR